MLHYSRFLFIILIILSIYYIWHITVSKNEFSTTIRTSTSSKKKIILMWTTIFGSRDSATLIDCPIHLQERCTLTYDRSLVDEAILVIFHANDLSNYDIPKDKKHFQKYVFMTMEAPPNHDRILYDIINGFFDWTMTYRLDSHIPMKYGGWWVDNYEAKRIGAQPTVLETDPALLLGKKKFSVVWLVSNCKTSSKREIAVGKLSRFIQVDIIGKCGKKPNCSYGKPCERDLTDTYYFYIAAENSLCKYYVTEKYWDRFYLPSVPIVLKRKYYEGIVPPKSVIAMDDFNSAKELADYLKHLMQNTTEYLKYFEWRKLGLARTWQQANYTSGYCRACEMAIKNPPSGNLSLKKWFFDPEQCEGSEFALGWKET